MCEQKIWINWCNRWIWINLKFNSNWILKHLSCSDRSVPVHADQASGPLNLKEIGRTRLHHTGSLSELIWTVGSRSDGSGRDGGDTHRLWLGFQWSPTTCSSGVDAGDLLELLGDKEDVDDGRSNLASSTVWSTSLFSASCDAGWRLKQFWASTSCGLGRGDRLAAEEKRRGHEESAHGEGELIGTKRRRRGHLLSSELCLHGDSTWDLRWEIAASWRHNSERERERRAGRSRGLYRGFYLGKGARVWRGEAIDG
jgi:hypothetical protein